MAKSRHLSRRLLHASEESTQLYFIPRTLGVAGRGLYPINRIATCKNRNIKRADQKNVCETTTSRYNDHSNSLLYVRKGDWQQMGVLSRSASS